MPHEQHGGRLVSSVAFTLRTPRIVAARKLRRRRERDAAGRFLAEGPQAVREALAAGRARELFVTADALARQRELVNAADAAAVPVSSVADDVIEALAETVAPQGVVAVCDRVDVPFAQALGARPRLVVLLVDIRDPGNAGTVLRTADAAGADAVIFVGDTVDPYNGKCVRASAGSLFHVPVAREHDPMTVVAALGRRGVRVLAASGYGDQDLTTLAAAGGLVVPTAWAFGSEAHGLPAEVMSAAAATVRVPVYGRAESLNLAAAAAVCLYASASAQADAAPQR
ncbi:RNA methyltransferase [Pilimelia columellifera]|uniref:RNA methyltransferase n=1 Tax=Pilimelia columellifera subsp. columellifera TaxID=706583 RepID=A0ABP6AZQ2_9ACTN